MGKHESIRRQLAGLALGELSERERSEILVHVGRCDRCRAELARIERLLGLAGKRKGLSADESLLASARDRLFAATRDENKAETTARPHIRWALAGRRIMRSRIAQLATAAVVVVALSIAFKMSSASRLDAAELLAQAARNMGKLAWVKTVTQVYVPDRNEPVETDVSWTDAANRRDYIIFDNKYIHMADYTRGELSVYRPDTNDMIVSPLKGESVSSGEQMIKEYVEKLKSDGCQARQSSRMYGDARAIVLEFDETLNELGGGVRWTNMLMNGKSVKTIRNEIIIDEKSHTPRASTVTYVDLDGRVIATHRSQCESAATGPANIYELGVPRSVKIINKVTDQPVQAVRQKIEEAGRRFLDEYIAVITKADVEEGREVIEESLVVFRQGKRVRVDGYSHASRGDAAARDKLTSRYAEALKASLQCLDSYDAAAENQDIRFVRLYDGLWQYALDAEEGRLVASERQRRPDGDGFGGDEIDELGWRTLWWLNEPEHTLEDSYSRGNRLIGMELSAQAVGSQPPKRLALYVDPEKDYMFQRYVEEQLIDAPWQEDKAWLDAVQDKSALTELVRECRVSEYARTTSGQWYPKTITETGYRREYGLAKRDTSLTTRIHLIAEHPTFPEGIFDPDKLPK